MIKTLDEFAEPSAIEEYKEPSDSTDVIYKPTINPPLCQCRDFVYHGNICKHIQRSIIKKLTGELNYYRSRTVKGSKAKFDTFEQLMEIYEHSDNWEVRAICNLFLVLLFNGPQTTDAIHEVMKDTFQHDKRIIGVVIRKLREQGLIKAIGEAKSCRKVNHGSYKCIYKLNKNVIDVINGLEVC